VELSVAIELECAALYEVFAKAFQGRADLVYFWKLYAEAERYHAASIRIHQATFEPDGVVPDDPAARRFLEELRGHRMRYEREPITVKESLKLARMVEEHSEELHGRTQFFANNPGLQDLFTKMAEEDRAHRDMLSTAEQKFGA
jgi:hypothetical protein